MNVEILPDVDSLAKRAAAVIAADARAAVSARGRFVMAVSGGKSPWLMLADLANEDVPWPNVHVFQIDERIAPAGDPDRNYVHLRDSLLQHAPIPPEQIYAMPVELPDAEAAAKEYAHTLEGVAGKPPVLDLAHLGLGPDGHTRLAYPWRSRAQRRRCRCRYHRRLPGPPPYDADVPRHQPFTTHPLAGQWQRQDLGVSKAARRRSIYPCRTHQPIASAFACRSRRRRRIAPAVCVSHSIPLI